MDCPTCEQLVDAYVDGELSAAESAAFEQALTGCPHCARRLEEARALSGLLRALPDDPAPDLLRARVERELRAIGARSRPAVARPTYLRWGAMAASLIVAVSLGWMGGSLSTQGGRDTDELLASYMRVASSDQPVDVVSSDRHTVKPWFAGRIDYSPPVYDLTAAGFPLLGGRLDVFDGRKVSVLVYRRNQHRVPVIVRPSDSTTGAPLDVTQRDGFTIGRWRHAGFEMRAASDISPAEMQQLQTAMDRAVDTDH
ncbi:MAG: anti-sigma factor [Alphaproteobacteria bacterium]|nr:anti-sigma factor [Alphaproteobacteria bacterium]